MHGKLSVGSGGDRPDDVLLHDSLSSFTRHIIIMAFDPTF